MRKVYVDVKLINTKDGILKPIQIQWEDGEVFDIDMVKVRVKAASTKVGGLGMRYTILVKGKETFLFHEDNKWFVQTNN